MSRLDHLADTMKTFEDLSFTEARWLVERGAFHLTLMLLRASWERSPEVVLNTILSDTATAELLSAHGGQDSLHRIADAIRDSAEGFRLLAEQLRANAPH